MEDLIDLFVHKATSWRDWLEVGSKEEHRLGRKNISSIDIDIKIGNIEIKRSEDEELIFNAYKKIKGNDASREELDRRLKDEVLVEYNIVEDVLYIKSDYKDDNIINKNIETSVELYIPKTIESIKVEVDIGSVSVGSIENNIELKTNIGNIELDGFKGVSNIKSGVGNIIGKNIILEKESRIELGTGNIYIGLDNKEGDYLYLGTNIGNIRLKVDDGLEYNLAKKNLVKESKIDNGHGMKIVLEAKVGKTSIENS